MKRIGLMIGFLALLFVVLPPLTGQDGKKDEVKKDEAKKDEPKKDDVKKDEPKKDEAKKDEPKKDDDKKKPEAKKSEKEKLTYFTKLTTKIVSANSESGRDITVEVQELDPKKVYETNVWAAQRQTQLAQDLFNAQKQKGQQYLQAMAGYNTNVAKFQAEKAQKNLYSPKNLDLKGAENAKVRVLNFPAEFDDAGNLKQPTKKDIEERKDKTGLPGFPADFDAIKVGQVIDIYLSKPPPASKAQPKKKAADDDDTPVPAAQAKQEYVMIVIRAEPKQK